MKLVSISNKGGKYISKYDITYENKDGDKVVYEVASRNNKLTKDNIGEKINAVAIVAYVGQKILLCREFRLAVNRWVYNFPAGLVDDGETVEETAIRELKEETGLDVIEIIKVLPPSYSSVGLTDEKVSIVMVEAKGEILGSDNVNEEIESRLYTKEEIRKLMSGSYDMCTRTQLLLMMLSLD